MTGLIESLRRHFPHLDEVPPGSVLAGGPVRDALLGRQPADLDFASFDAAGDAGVFARRTGGRHVTLGTRFQTERVVVDGKAYDFSPVQGSSVEDDLGRRDFTINAIALERDGRLLDPFDGAGDLERGIVRMVRENNLREDPLRVVRAPRMTAAFGFSIDAETLAACRRGLESLTSVPAERVTGELRLILGAAHPRRAAEDLHAIGIDRYAFGFELDEEDVHAWERMAATHKESSDPGVATITLLLAGHPQHRDRFLERWMWSRDEVRRARAALRIIDARPEGHATLFAAAEEGRVATELAATVLEARGRDDSVLREILERSPSPFDIAPLLDGHEIAALTGARGAAIGRLKRALWEKQVTGEVRTVDEARQMVESAS